MGLKHEAKKGTVIEISGPARITVLRGAPQLAIEASSDVVITMREVPDHDGDHCEKPRSSSS